MDILLEEAGEVQNVLSNRLIGGERLIAPLQERSMPCAWVHNTFKNRCNQLSNGGNWAFVVGRESSV